jgi:tryptophan halogenase
MTDSNNEKIRIVIVGGGTAGWLTAFSISTIRKDVACISIDSSKLGAIGVGEGTTGLFLDYLTDLGLDFDEIIRETNALPKYGINFINWTGDQSSYISPIDGSYFPSSALDTLFFGSLAFDKDINLTSRCSTLIKNKSTDLFLTNGKVSKKFSYPALHLDTFKTIEYLKKKSMNNGCEFVDSEVVSVNLDTAGNIQSLSMSNGSTISGDLFIDCTGFGQVLISKLNPTWIDYSNYLPVDCALTFKVDNDSAEKNLYTTATALNDGWMFEIPTRQRIGRGYIYSSKFADEQKIIKELEDRFQSNIHKVKSIKFDSGRLKNSWVKNCIAIGLSSAFLEPLQATSIHCTIIQIRDFILNCLADTADNSLDPVIVESHNNRISKLYQGMVDFISMHYSGGRTDTEFWKYISNNVKRTPKASEIIHLSTCRLPRQCDFDVHVGFAGPNLWNYSLNGLGHFKKDVLEKITRLANINPSYINNAIAHYYKETQVLTAGCFNIDQLINELEKKA